MNIACNDIFFNIGLRAIIDELIQDLGDTLGFRCWQVFKNTKVYAYTYADMTMLPWFFERCRFESAVIFCPPRAARVMMGTSIGKSVLVLSMGLEADKIKMALMKRFLCDEPAYKPYQEGGGCYDGPIVKLALSGIPYKDASKLALISKKTISYRKRMLMKKLGVQNKTELFFKLKIMGLRPAELRSICDFSTLNHS